MENVGKAGGVPPGPPDELLALRKLPATLMLAGTGGMDRLNQKEGLALPAIHQPY